MVGLWKAYQSGCHRVSVRTQKMLFVCFVYFSFGLWAAFPPKHKKEQNNAIKREKENELFALKCPQLVCISNKEEEEKIVWSLHSNRCTAVDLIYLPTLSTDRSILSIDWNSDGDQHGILMTTLKLLKGKIRIERLTYFEKRYFRHHLISNVPHNLTFAMHGKL